MIFTSFYKRIALIIIATGFVLSFWVLWYSLAGAASFSISPAGGTHAVGSTFEVSVLVDTKQQEINAVQMQLAFPADKLQLVSPSAGNSIIEIYTTPPKFDNSTGRVEIIGGIPNGINVSNGLISKLTFRVKGVGSASLRFTGESQVLLNDGRGTNVLDNTFGATYKLELPPQQGPIVVSDTHPDQEVWYGNQNVSLQWDIGLEPAENYSYTISDNPSDVPDDTPETNETKVDYKQVANGINYFHIKAFRDNRWGGVSHYSIKVDNVPPAEFKIGVTPSAKTFVTRPVFDFTTTDSFSGLDRYEIKIIPIKIEGRSKAVADDQLFVDANSPYQPTELLHGTYEVIVRAYDKSGNIREVNQKIEITDSWWWFLSQDGVTLPFGKQVRWGILVPFSLILLVILLGMAYYFRRLYKMAHQRVTDNHYPEVISSQLTELQKYRQKYGNLVSVFLLAVVLGSSMLVPGLSLAQVAETDAISNTEQSQQSSSGSNNNQVALEQTPPVITSYSSNIKDDELFYVSGRTTEPNSEVVVHLQSMVDGGAFDFTTTADRRGDWTYRHSDFLAGGKYIIWAHTKVNGQLSSPSPQVEIDVKPIALNWGNSRITYQSIYIGLITALMLMVFALLVYIIVHALLVRHRRKIFAHNIRQAEDSIKRGFIALRRDIEAELMLMKQAHLPDDLAGEQKVREEQLKADLKNIEEIVGKEVWQVETFEHLPTQSS